jgi:hypothetical protein
MSTRDEEHAVTEYYERAPDGTTWPGTLAGLLKALDDTALESSRLPGEYTLSAIRSGNAEPIRIYQNGAQL